MVTACSANGHCGNGPVVGPPWQTRSDIPRAVSAQDRPGQTSVEARAQHREFPGTISTLVRPGQQQRHTSDQASRSSVARRADLGAGIDGSAVARALHRRSCLPSRCSRRDPFRSSGQSSAAATDSAVSTCRVLVAAPRRDRRTATDRRETLRVPAIRRPLLHAQAEGREPARDSGQTGQEDLRRHRCASPDDHGRGVRAGIDCGGDQRPIPPVGSGRSSEACPGCGTRVRHRGVQCPALRRSPSGQILGKWVHRSDRRSACARGRVRQVAAATRRPHSTGRRSLVCPPSYRSPRPHSPARTHDIRACGCRGRAPAGNPQRSGQSWTSCSRHRKSSGTSTSRRPAPKHAARR